MGAVALRFLMLTACRSGEVCGARWDEIDLQNRLWCVPAGRMKSGRPHRVALSDAACGLLEPLLGLRQSGLVFSAYKAGVPVADRTLKHALTRHGYHDFTVHGMRSTFRDWCADTGKSFDLAEAALAHVAGSAVVRAYARSDLLDGRRALMAAWADYLTREPAEVIPLRVA
jgi:integrase